ncbi:MAG: hypothetical protein J3Q66DRAFT_437819 [Benniella sp.]|nr:MAG: hypothetical protein J3Q66DRAFT_437819 [Benniella sp.]
MSMDKAAQKQHPLHLPEVLFQVTLYLDAKDVLACSLVCRTFQSAFAPYVWGNLHVGLHPSQRTVLRHQDPFVRFISVDTQVSNNQEQSQVSEEGQPSAEDDGLPQVLQRAAPWIRSLSIHEHHSTSQLKFGERCTLLESLLIKGPPWNDRFDTTYWDSCKALVRQNSAHLRSLIMILWNKSCGGRNRPKWTPLFECVQHKTLRSLSVKGGSINEKQRTSYWQVFENLESLTLESTYVAPPPYIPSGKRKGSKKNRPITLFPKLRTLTLNQLVNTGPVHQLDWIIGICPMLQTLEWSLAPKTFFPVQFVHYFVEMTWPELDSITIKGHRDYMSHENYISILQATQRPFKVLDLKIQYLSPNLISQLRQSHFKTLIKVDLSSAVSSLDHPTFYTAAIPRWAQEVLESCLLLEHITAKTITAQDIINGKPWVCLGLKEFKVMINMGFGTTKPVRGAKRPKFTEAQQELCRAVFEQLGRLQQLRVLDMRRNNLYPGSRTYFPLPLELRLGLGQLSRLEDIEVIGFHYSQDLRIPDVTWMLRSWPYLVAVYGTNLSCKRSRTYGNEYVRNHKLASMLKSRGVRYQRDEDDTEMRVSLAISALYDTESESESESESENESGWETVSE